MKKNRILLIILLSVFVSDILFGQTYKYIGAEKCKICHNKASTGEQYNKWLKDPHSQALKTLSNQESLDYAKKNGIPDPSKEQKCLKCHSTYATVSTKLRGGILPDEGVSCESCHGPGSSYKSPAIMKNAKQALETGLILPDKDLCIICHNKENPFHKEFNFETYSEKIAHPNPLAKK